MSRWSLTSIAAYVCSCLWRLLRVAKAGGGPNANQRTDFSVHDRGARVNPAHAGVVHRGEDREEGRGMRHILSKTIRSRQTISGNILWLSLQRFACCSQQRLGRRHEKRSNPYDILAHWMQKFLTASFFHKLKPFIYRDCSHKERQLATSSRWLRLTISRASLTRLTFFGRKLSKFASWVQQSCVMISEMMWRFNKRFLLLPHDDIDRTLFLLFLGFNPERIYAYFCSTIPVTALRYNQQVRDVSTQRMRRRLMSIFGNCWWRSIPIADILKTTASAQYTAHPPVLERIRADGLMDPQQPPVSSSDNDSGTGRRVQHDLHLKEWACKPLRKALS